MAKQLHELATSSMEPHITVQITPFGAGAHPGVLGSFAVLEFPVRNDLDVVYTEALMSSLYLKRDNDVTVYNKAFDRLRAAALDVEPSWQLVAQIAKDFES